MHGAALTTVALGEPPLFPCGSSETPWELDELIHRVYDVIARFIKNRLVCLEVPASMDSASGSLPGTN